MNRYMTVFYVSYFDSNMVNNELKRFTSAVKTEQPEVVLTVVYPGKGVIKFRNLQWPNLLIP